MGGRREWEKGRKGKRRMMEGKWREGSGGGGSQSVEGLGQEFSARWEMKLDRWYCACETFELNEREIFLLLGK